MKNQTMPEVVSATFQGQKIQYGSYLFMFKYSEFVRVLALVECGPQLCVVVEYENAEFVRSLTANNFCTIPSYEEGLQERKEDQKKTVENRIREEIQYYVGQPCQNPNVDNLIYINSKKNVVRMIAESGNRHEGFFISLALGQKIATKAAVPYKAFLNVFFKDRRKEFDPSFRSVSKVETDLRRKYQETFRIIDGMYQHPKGLSFQEWQIKKRF